MLIAGLLAMLQAPSVARPPASAPFAATVPADAGAPPGTPASTAVTLREVDTRLTVPVLVNGKGPYRFIVDSGATRTVVSARLAAVLALPAAGTLPLHSVGGESDVAAVRIDALYVGALPVRSIVAPVLDEADLGSVGILGIDALAHNMVLIDLARHSMSVARAARSAAPAAANEIVITARSRFGQLVLADADVAGQRVYAVVDTGSMVTIGNRVLEAKLVRHKRAVPRAVTITDVTGREIIASYAPISNLRLGAFRMQNSVIAFDDAHVFARFGLEKKPAMLLGMDVLQAFTRVLIDFEHRKVRLLHAGEGTGVE